jgi:hypothetical protein
MKRTNIHNLISRLADGEAQFLRTQFLAPVMGEGTVRVRIAGAICRLRIRPRDFAGWGVFHPTSFNDASHKRDATLRERRDYLALFPAVRLILVSREGPTWLAQPAQFADNRFKAEGAIPVHLVDDAEAFDTVVARFDGERFWFDEVDPQADPTAAAYLREAMLHPRHPRTLTRPGLTPEQRAAYSAEHTERLRRRLASERATGEYRVREALEHAGARLRGLNERHGFYQVTYTVDGRRHTSVIRKNDLTVQSAGICLSGMDATFDLASLVSVLREGQQAAPRGIFHGLQV